MKRNTGIEMRFQSQMTRNQNTGIIEMKLQNNRKNTNSMEEK
jgi:hypothetical protein